MPMTAWNWRANRIETPYGEPGWRPQEGAAGGWYKIQHELRAEDDGVSGHLPHVS